VNEPTQPPPTPAPTPESKPASSAPPPNPAHDGSTARKAIGGIITVVILVVAIMLSLSVWDVIEHHPRTDDAVARANVVPIVPRARGQIVKILVQDNELVKQDDVLFEIDPDDYKLALEKANADLASLDEQIAVARSQDAELKFAVIAAEAAVDAGNAQLKQADDTYHRLQPLLPKGFATAEQVDQAATAKSLAFSGLAADEQHLNQAKSALSALQSLMAQRAGALAAVHLAQLELSYCEVRAPFPGRIIDLNISPGAYASAGVPVFSMLDTRKWYVIANFREGEIRHLQPGSTAELYLLSAPDRRFTGRVQGIAWAVEPEDEIDIPHSLPYVKRELNWVHVAQRFPVRIEVDNPDPELFRMGESAVAIITGDPPK
jgi:membrane fusion protein, multidrug efflux system